MSPPDPDETTGLLPHRLQLPSAAANGAHHHPSTFSYQGQDCRKKKREKKECRRGGVVWRSTAAFAAFAAALLAAAAFFGYYRGGGRPGGGQLPYHWPSSNSNGGDEDRPRPRPSGSATSDGTTYDDVDDFLGPLSLLRPVEDLGLAPYDDRPEDSRPPRTLLTTATNSNNNKKKDGGGGDDDDDDDGTSGDDSSRGNSFNAAAAYPTNAWYQNMLLVGDDDEPSPHNNRAYAVPYVVDAGGLSEVPGLRVHYNRVAATNDVVQVFLQESFGLTLGVASAACSSTSSPSSSSSSSAGSAPTRKLSSSTGEGSSKSNSSGNGSNTKALTHRYTVPSYTNLGFTMAWEATDGKMSSTVTKGMPYATMVYDDIDYFFDSACTDDPGARDDSEASSSSSGGDDLLLLPTIASEIPLRQDPIVDGGWRFDENKKNKNDNSTGSDATSGNSSGTNEDVRRLKCSPSSSGAARNSNNEPATLVEREIEMLFDASDFTWLVFFSEPVHVRCLERDGGIRVQVVGLASGGGATAEGGGGGEERSRHHHRGSKNNKKKLVVRAALYKSCSSGRGSPLYCHQEQMHPTALLLGQGEYGRLLRDSAHLYPGPNPTFSYEVVAAASPSSAAERAAQSESRLGGGKGGADEIRMTFDWDVQEFETKISSHHPAHEDTPTNETARASPELLNYALPHHIDMLEDWVGKSTFESQIYCTASLLGPACLMKGSKWQLVDAAPDIRLQAARPPAPYAVPALALSLRDDLKYDLPKYYRQGAGDTYFSGKQLAKLGRIVLIAEELSTICSSAQAPEPDDGSGEGRPQRADKVVSTEKIVSTKHEVGAWNSSLLDYQQACQASVVPTEREIERAVARLRRSVEIWLNGKAVTPFVYDSAWGGVVSCGCDFKKSTCLNRYPHCPAFADPGMNFGNAFYNDQHFHYGYHIYAAAVVAHFDPDWGRRFYERVLLLIRNIANPSEDDPHFPTWRHKDWYQGHSWASGIPQPPYPNGKNQESSSEAVAAYEAIALYGKVMAENAMREDDSDLLRAANEVRAVGQVMTASELRSARKYWHVSRSPDEAIKIYPSNYKLQVIGMVWQMMAQFQTWFGSAPYLVYGIQLLPLTPISEQRDGLSWSKQMYKSFAESCQDTQACYESGWSVLQTAVLATVGHQREALDQVIKMNSSNFDGPAGDGHSRSNTLWYIATRPAVEVPLSLLDNTTEASNATSPNCTESANATFTSCNATSPSTVGSLTCNRPDTCTDYALDTVAGLYTCRQRIQWLMQRMGKSMEDACIRVAVADHPNECGACDPNGPSSSDSSSSSRHHSSCPPCTAEECASDFNRCPRYDKTFVCTKGPSVGGCSPTPWSVGVDSAWQCKKCCELSSCPLARDPAQMNRPGKEVDKVATGEQKDCPPCAEEVCQSRLNQCPSNGAAPFLCYDGLAAGGCSPMAWRIDGPQCNKCCTVNSGCTRGHSHVRA